MKKVNTHLVIAIVLFAVLSFLIACGSREEKISPQIVTFGDSIFGEIRDETAIPVLLEELTEMSVYNGAMGGTCAARIQENMRLDYATESLSLVGLVKSVYADDFGVQQAGKYHGPVTEYFEEVIDGLAQVDFEKVEIVLIQHGVNDYHAGTPIENPEDPYDEYTFLGALRTGVELIKKVNPEVRIVLVTPPYAWYVLDWKTCEEQDFGGGVLEEYVNAEIAFAEEMGLEVIDMYHDFIPTATWDDCGVYTRDGLHPSPAGRVLWAEKIAGELIGK